MTFVADTNGTTICNACGARIRNTTADKVEHLTTPSRAVATLRRKQTTAKKAA